MPWRHKPIEIYKIPDVDYFLFMDESGEHNLNNFDNTKPVFTLNGVMVEVKQYTTFKRRINAFKDTYWENGCFLDKGKHPKKVCFHSREIRRRSGAFSKHYFDDVQYNQFMDELTSMMQELSFELIAACIDKQTLVSRYIHPKEPYELALEFIIERFAKFLNTQNKTGIIILESRGTKEDAKLLELFLELFNDGTNFVSHRVLQRTITAGLYFNPKWNKAKENLDTFVGLEIADLCAHPIGHFAFKNEKSKPFLTIESKFLGFPNYQGKGLKLFP
ncbi:DUF3800 domain-containing protein [Sulfuricurvum sp.]|uniref:DUF3800 domain-containing protein n=1 Tax=Sulfuricurvum sp. TaxID=2025608 RepID=UPI00286D8730|nr:DUF3800 domain-containing protein [Sulfuricurvum sp.]